MKTTIITKSKRQIISGKFYIAASHCQGIINMLLCLIKMPHQNEFNSHKTSQCKHGFVKRKNKREEIVSCIIPFNIKLTWSKDEINREKYWKKEQREQRKC